MKLYLMQHGKALSEEQDQQRPLSPEGKKETKKLAQFLKQKNIEIDFIWHSKKLRSAQTAQIVAGYLENAIAQEREDINPNDSVDKFTHEIRELSEELLIVGHLPFLQRLTGKLLRDHEDDDVVPFRYSGIVCLEYTDRWRVSWVVAPDLL